MQVVQLIRSQNFFSDLGRSVTYSGQDNWLSFFLFNSCVSFAGVVFILFYLHFNKLFTSDKKNKILTIIGTFFCILGSLCLIGVALTPANLLYDPHNFCSKWTFRLFFPGTLCYAIALFRSTYFNNKMAYAYLSWALLVITYVLVSELGPPSTQSNAALVFQVVSQKLIVLTFVVNILYQTAEIKKLFIPKSYQ